MYVIRFNSTGLKFKTIELHCTILALASKKLWVSQFQQDI